jgi:hypothetical protein
MSTESTEVRLLKQEDWPAWYDFIRSEGITGKIWGFVDPDQQNVPINVKPDVFYYTRDRSTQTTSTQSTTSTASSATVQPTPTTDETPTSTEPPIDSGQIINPKFYAAYGQQADNETLKLTLEEMISEFNLSYKPPTGRRAAFPTLSGESIPEETNTPDDKPVNTPRDTSGNRGKCAACGGRHNVKKCRNLFEELRPDGWVVNEPQERRCHEYLKTSDGRTLYQEQKKHFATNPPAKPI